MTEPIICTWEEMAGKAGKEAAPAIKAILGWKGVAVWDPDVDPVDLLRAYFQKMEDESCGQCFPCRLGSQRLVGLMNLVCAGRGDEAMLDEMADLVRTIADSARCDIGQSVGKPALDMLEKYRDEFLAVATGKQQVKSGTYEATVTAPCMSACPSHVDIPAYLEGIRNGQYAEALAKVRRDCAMPGTIGRVCVRPCEANCRRGLLDEPLAIRGLKRFLADWEMETGADSGTAPGPDKGKKVAIVGAGPAGLAAAYYLGKMGYKSTIFEAQEEAGGMARYGIPSYRLPRDILLHEAEVVRSAGAEIRFGVKMGEDVKVEELAKQGYSAVFLGLGAPESSKMRCEGEDAGYECFMTGVMFLGLAARGIRPIEGGKLVVVGGGNVAMDCVRTALRTGFADVNLLYRRTEAEMPADPQEIKEAKEEGVKFHYLVAPVSIEQKNGKVSGLKCRRMELGEPDASGRRRPVPVEGSDYVIECDAIIPAVGQVCVVDCVLPESEGGVTPWKTLVVDEATFQSKTPGIFGGGDCVTGPATLIAALAAGKKAAHFMAQYLEEGSCHLEPGDLVEKLVNANRVFDPKEKWAFKGMTHRAEPFVMEPEERIKGFEEVEHGFKAHEARKEAERCLRCYRIAVAAV